MENYCRIPKGQSFICLLLSLKIALIKYLMTVIIDFIYKR